MCFVLETSPPGSSCCSNSFPGKLLRRKLRPQFLSACFISPDLWLFFSSTCRVLILKSSAGVLGLKSAGKHSICWWTFPNVIHLSNSRPATCAHLVHFGGCRNRQRMAVQTQWGELISYLWHQWQLLLLLRQSVILSHRLAWRWMSRWSNCSNPFKSLIRFAWVPDELQKHFEVNGTMIACSDCYSVMIALFNNIKQYLPESSSGNK